LTYFVLGVLLQINRQVISPPPCLKKTPSVSLETRGQARSKAQDMPKAGHAVATRQTCERLSGIL